MLCNKTCDNCHNPSKIDNIDMTEIAKNVIRLLERGEKFTEAQTILYLKGGAKAKGKSTYPNGFGCAKGVNDVALSNLIKQMIHEQLLEETMVTNHQYGGIVAYLKVGKRDNINKMMKGSKRIMIRIKRADSSDNFLNRNDQRGMTKTQNDLMTKLNELCDEIFEEVRQQPGKQTLLKHNLFDPKTLMKIASIMPKTLEEFRQINMKKLIRVNYAQRFVNTVNNFLQNNVKNYRRPSGEMNQLQFNDTKKLNEMNRQRKPQMQIMTKQRKVDPNDMNDYDDDFNENEFDLNELDFGDNNDDYDNYNDYNDFIDDEAEEEPIVKKRKVAKKRTKKATTTKKAATKQVKTTKTAVKKATKKVAKKSSTTKKTTKKSGQALYSFIEAAD